jgi:hypothetical protein
MRDIRQGEPKSQGLDVMEIRLICKPKVGLYIFV